MNSHDNLVSYHVHLLVIMGIQMSCIFTAYKKFYKPKANLRLTHLQTPINGRLGIKRKLYFAIGCFQKSNGKLLSNHNGAPEK